MLGAILAIAAIVAAVVVAAVVLYDALIASRSAADKNFSSNPVGVTAQSCPLNKSLKGKVKQLTWGGGIAVSRKDGSTRASPQAVLQALTELLIEKKIITQEELLNRVAGRTE